ncbi:MAG: hypothetical protein HQK89_16780, partial [Nitrospirae bacterium]|nr:hypothetical protein [Nitrospirota bacterium]
KDKDEVAEKFYLKKKEAFISGEKVAAYLFSEDGTVRSIYNKKKKIIEWDTFSKVSEKIANLYYEI